MRDADIGIYMENSTLGNFARNTAASLEPEGYVRGSREANRTLAVLRRLHARLTPRTPAGEDSPAWEWFSDNWYIAEREGRAAARTLRPVGRLPRAAGSRRAVVCEAAAALVRSGRGEVTGERMALFLREYQKTRPLSERELSVFVPAVMAELAAFLESVLPAPGEDDGEAALLLRNIFTSLRALAAEDLSDVLEEANVTEALLRQDPAGVYPLMDEETRRDYRRELARLAEKRGLSERDAAKKVLELAQNGEERHVGFHIFRRPLGRERREHTGEGYIAAFTAGTLFFTVLAGVATDSLFAALLALLPVSELVKAVLDAVLLRAVRPKRLPRLELEKGVPESAATVCVISALLSGEKDGEKYAGLLEEYSLLNRDAGKNLMFGILADLPEARSKRTGEDGRILSRAAASVEGLNKKYGGGFFLFVRERVKNDAEGVWMGRERKRGAIEELVRLLSGESSALRIAAGDRERLRGAAFILTLDADTRPTAGSARELIGAALHPLNTPRIDGSLGRVVSGYAILEPRVSVDLGSAGRTDFSRIFAGVGGVDPYGSTVSDLYQDLFSEGIFMGKGLINVPVYRRVLDGTFPDNTVLSHDILEGAYLRCGLLSDVEFTDGWPGKVTSYFARQERWTRGDWQNLRWCARLIRGRDGALRRNNLTGLSRFKIFDNLRRSLVAPAVLLDLLLWAGFPSAATALSGALALAAYLSGVLIEFAGDLIRHDGSGRARYQSSVLPGPGGAIMRSAVRLMLLPMEAWTNARAAVTALWRMCVTHRGLLRWVTAGDAERRRVNTLLVNYRELLACPVAAALLLLVSRTPLGGALALVWAFTPAYAWALSRETAGKRRVSQRDRAFLLNRAGEIWRFFADHLTREDNFLPPDNVQLAPNIGAAHRTSPTNIGLAMLSCIAAADLGLITPQEASDRVKRTLETVERLEKWHGHLYNWYDTRTLAPLEPRYVSTVDSGNLTGALIAVKEWFYSRNDPETARRCGDLVDGADFTPLFDKKRKLFHIGIDLMKNAPTEGWYDLLASEARETSYIAVALGQVPKKHWRRLGRARVSLDRYSGMASWTGTMFEYLMPNLLLPCRPSSLLYESSRFCLFAQKRAHPGIPWGISESGFYAFDPGLAYRYKAHGVQRLALKRGMGAERVVSPYSTYLALPLDPAGASNNLRRLMGMGLAGPYGLYEAADFTPGRVREGRCEAVRSYMSHHLGMSLTAIANTLCGDVFPRRFMSDRRMAAFRELLEERLPTGRLTLRQPPRDVPTVPNRREAGGLVREFTETDAFSPACVPLSSGAYTVLFAETGKTRSRWRGLDLTCFDPAPDGAMGVEAYLRTPTGTLSLTPAPEFDGRTRYSCELTDMAGRIRSRAEGCSAVYTVSVPPSGEGEVRRVEVSAPAGVTEVSLVVVFEPVLRRWEDHASHPAFNRLSLEAAMERDVFTVTRRPRPGEGRVTLALAADTEFTAVTHRRRGDPPEAGDLLAWSPDMRVAVTVPIRLAMGKGRATVALAAAESREEAAAAARRMAARQEKEAVSRISAAALMLGMNQSEIRSALDLATPLLFGGDPGRTRTEERMRAPYGREELWKLGISGDLPVVAARVGSVAELAEAQNLIKRHALLSENGVESDLVLVLTDNGDYAAAQKTSVTDLLRRLGREGTLGVPGGVHITAEASPSPAPVLLLADVTVPLSEPPSPPLHRAATPRPLTPFFAGGGAPACRVGEDGRVLIALRDCLPGAAWSHILTNPNYGFVATECGTGFQWHLNSRLRKISPWVNDAMATEGPERLKLLLPQGERSLFADGGEEPTLIEYGFGWARWERDFGAVRSAVTAFVPPETDARIMTVELSGELTGVRLEYACRLLLGESEKDAKNLQISWENGQFTAKNPSGEFKKIPYTLLTSAAPEEVTSDWRRVLAGEFDGACGPAAFPCIAFRVPAAERLVIVSGCDAPGKLDRALKNAAQLLEETKEHWRGLCSALAVETPDRRLNTYLNGWAVYQIRACRMLARTSLYQNGGAVGFRDQLQDAAAMTLIDPAPARWQIRQAAAHQFPEGDVMHWWHQTPGGDKGVRTRCSDDLLWLCWALTDHVSRTGDLSILSDQEPFRVSEPLKDGERDRYETPGVSAETQSVLQHAIRAADLFLSRGTGAHGLARMLGGDWNDGMDRVGAGGRGESVWLTFFGSLTLRRMAELCERAGEEGCAQRYADAADRLLKAGENAWGGDWYLRGTYDDGRTLGAPGDGECQIDSVAQSFAFFAGADKLRTRRALRSAAARLWDRDRGVVKLFDPPFDRGETEPGYIKSYAPGFRENGGQYTHAAVWLAMALLESGQREEGARMLLDLAPWGRDGEVYAAEPYVLCGDVYTAPGLEGRGGWSWYTGSAGWYFRAATEALFGLRLRDGVLYVEPNLPDSLYPAAVALKVNGRELDIRLYPEGVLVNGEEYKKEGIRLYPAMETEKK